MLNDMVSRHGAVWLGLEWAVLCAEEAASSTASGVCASRGGERGCLAVSWVGGDCVCTRRGRCTVCGLRSRVVLGRTLGMVAGSLGAVRARGPGLGKARGWDSEWRWTVGCLPDMLSRLVAAPSLLSTMGWQGCARLFTIDGNGKLTVVLVVN